MVSKRIYLKYDLLSERRERTSDGFGCVCPMCGKIVGEDGAMHEAIVSRGGGLPKEKQYAIMVSENCVIVHQKCHSTRGAMYDKCLAYLMRWHTKEEILGWIKSLPMKDNRSYYYECESGIQQLTGKTGLCESLTE